MGRLPGARTSCFVRQIRMNKVPPARPLEIRAESPMLPGLCEGAVGAPVVAGAYSGIHFISLRSYLKPLAFLSASFVEFMTRYHLLLFLFVT